MRRKKHSCTRLWSWVLLLLMLGQLCACVPAEKEPSDPFTTARQEDTTPEDIEVILPATDEELHRVAYIPIDNRPVNQERAQYLAQSVGIELLMPNEELYRTALDNMQPNADGSTSGNREALLAWLLEADRTCDRFIISLDQMTSGGLVSSRYLSNTDLSLEYSIIDTIVELCRENTVYVFDTVMRLASTVNYQGYREEEYHALRAYGRVARRVLSDDALTLENIIAGYGYDSAGEPIPLDISETARDSYHASRERKLKIADYFLRSAADEVEFVYLAVDDSSPQNTIQTNEIRYLEALMGERGVLSAACDELGLCCLARMASQIYGEAAVCVTYYGPGEHQPADGYDIGTLHQGVQAHLQALSATEAQKDETALQVLLLTRGSTSADRIAILTQVKENQKAKIPTVLIDVSEEPQLLGEALMNDSAIDICRLLGYSSWNTAANAMGLALSQGVARYAYLSNVEIASASSCEGFLKAMTFAYVKDISYKCFSDNLNDLIAATGACSLSQMIERIEEGEVLLSLTDPVTAHCGGVELYEFRYPWDRTFEMTFDMASMK